MKTVSDLFESLAQDARYAVRSLCRQPSFALTVVLTLALGIGAATTIFTLFDALLLRPLPVAQPERLVIVGDPSEVGDNASGPPLTQFVSYPLYKDVRNSAQHVLSGLDASGQVDLEVVAPGGAGAAVELPQTRAVTGNFFSLLQVSPFAGRLLTDDDDGASAAAVVVLSYAYWQRRFGGDRSILGSSLTLNGVKATIVGIARSGFTGDVVGESTDLWLPMSLVGRLPGQQDKVLENRSWSWLQMMGRLAPGVPLSRARQEITAIELNAARAQLTGKDLDDFNHDAEATPLQVEAGARGFSSKRVIYASAMAILMAAVTLLALVVCANLANLTLARAVARTRELTVRMTLGAARRRLVAQLLTESAIVGIAGAAVALLVRNWATSTLLALVDSVTFLDVQSNARVFAFAAGATIVAVLLFGLIPAIRATGVDAATTLRAQGRGAVGTHTRFGRSLVAAQIALSTLLLVGAGLLVQSARNLLNADLGFDSEHVLIVRTRDNASYQGAALGVYRQRLEQRATEVPGVIGVSFSRGGLLSGSVSNRNVAISGVVTVADTQSAVTLSRVGANYLRATGASLLAGRDFSAADEQVGANRAIIDQTMARAYFKDRDPLGQLITMNGNNYTVVGVVRDIEERGVREAPVRRLYVSLSAATNDGPNFQLVVRTAGDPMQVVQPLRAALVKINANIPVELQSVPDRVRASVRENLLLTNITLGFGLVTLIIAALGLYGVTAYATSRRTSEFGLRMALGAAASSVQTMVVREALTTTVIGIAIGLPAGIAATRIIRSYMFGVGRIDVPSLSVAIGLLVVAAVVASWIPARRAAAIPAVEALKAE